MRGCDRVAPGEAGQGRTPEAGGWRAEKGRKFARRKFAGRRRGFLLGAFSSASCGPGRVLALEVEDSYPPGPRARPRAFLEPSRVLPPASLQGPPRGEPAGVELSWLAWRVLPGPDSPFRSSGEPTGLGKTFPPVSGRPGLRVLPGLEIGNPSRGEPSGVWLTFLALSGFPRRNR